jgi:hypothetical protein
MSRLGRWGRASGPGNDELRALEDWVRLRFQVAASDPMIAIIGAVGRFTDAGMTTDEAMNTVLRILNEEVADRSDPWQRRDTGPSPRQASVPPLDAL